METGAAVTSRRGLSGIGRGQGVCNQWKAKGQCSRGDQCSFWHDSDEGAKSTPKATPSSEPPTQRGRSASRKGTLRGRTPSGRSNRQQCKDFLKDICTKLPCDNGHPPECQFYKSEAGCKFGTECLFPHRKVEEQPSKKPKKDGDKDAVATLKDVRQVYSKTQGRQNLYRFYGRAQKSWDKFDEHYSQKQRSVTQTSEKTKEHRSVKYKSKFLISAVPAL